MTERERLTRQRHLHRGERPWQRFGVCTGCGRTRDEDGRPLWLTGRRRSRLLCLECFDLGVTPAERRAAA